MPVAIYHPEYEKYAFAGDHPFSPLRIAMVLDLLQALGHNIETLSPEPATTEDLLTVHAQEYLRAVASASSNGGMARPDFGLGVPDNPIQEGIEAGARRIVGGTLLGARLIAEGKAQKVLQLGGGLHHAMPQLASGFCIFNDLAIAIGELTRRGLSVAYLDIDVHHGDGVQRILYDQERVMTLSLHESGEYLFPGTGAIHELGRGLGRGFKLNLPLEPFTEGESYLKAFERIAEPALDYFAPNVLVVQAGADAHFSDPLADLMLTTHDYERLFTRLLEYADAYTEGRLLVTLGGGYSIRATPRIWTLLSLLLFDLPIPTQLPAPWLERWAEALGDDPPQTLHDQLPAFDPIPRRPEIDRHNRLVVTRLLDAVSMLWL
jgi:acetoin utilization protein AcuC